MADASGKRIFIIAGPNGAGKTTFAAEFLPSEPDCPIFINADYIAAGLNPLRSHQVEIQAGRQMLSRIREYASRGESFAFETALGGRGYARRIPLWRKRGYRIYLFFLRMPTPDAAVARVAQRVSEGGHDVPEAVIRRRFRAGWSRMEQLQEPLPGYRQYVGPV